jgi:hypothetical protein
LAPGANSAAFKTTKLALLIYILGKYLVASTIQKRFLNWQRKEKLVAPYKKTRVKVCLHKAGCGTKFFVYKGLIGLTVVPVIGKHNRIQCRTRLNKHNSVIECIYNSGASFYTQQRTKKNTK